MKLINAILMCLVFLSTPAFAKIDANDLDKFNTLSDSQKAEVIKQIDGMASNGPSVSSITPEVVKEKMKQWSEIGAGIGVLLVSTARELGVAANEFAQTPLGKLAITVGIAYMFGKSLVCLAVWIVAWFVFLPLIWRSYKKLSYREVTERKLLEQRLLWVIPLYDTKTERSPRSVSDGEQIFHVVAGIVFFLTGVIAITNV